MRKVSALRDGVWLLHGVEPIKRARVSTHVTCTSGDHGASQSGVLLVTELPGARRDYVKSTEVYT